jgi:hypothetical protein
MVAAFGARSVEYCAIRCGLLENLALEDLPVLQGEMEDIPLRRVRHGVEPHDCSLSIQMLQAVSDAAQVSMTAEETADPAERRHLRHLLIPESGECKDCTRGRPCSSLAVLSCGIDSP